MLTYSEKKELFEMLDKLNAYREKEMKHFREIVNKLLKMEEQLPADLVRILKEEAPMWNNLATMWEKLFKSLKKYIPPKSSNAISVKVYATLCGVSEAEIKKSFEQNEF